MLTAGIFVLYVIVAWMVLNIIADWLLFKKALKPGWHSLIPFLNTYDEYDICWSGNMGILYLLLFLGIQMVPQDTESTMLVFLAGIASLVMLVLHFRESIKLAKSFGKGTGYGIFLFFFDRVGRIILGLGDSKYIGRVH